MWKDLGPLFFTSSCMTQFRQNFSFLTDGVTFMAFKEQNLQINEWDSEQVKMITALLLCLIIAMRFLLFCFSLQNYAVANTLLLSHLFKGHWLRLHAAKYSGYGWVVIRVSKTFGISRLHAWAERVTPIYTCCYILFSWKRLSAFSLKLKKKSILLHSFSTCHVANFKMLYLRLLETEMELLVFLYIWALHGLTLD